eukprot:3582791-Alexandrium_andersonii.AAC.1
MTAGSPPSSAMDGRRYASAYSVGRSHITGCKTVKCSSAAAWAEASSCWRAAWAAPTSHTWSWVRKGRSRGCRAARSWGGGDCARRVIGYV